MLSANYLIKCGLTGCTQDNLVRYAYETNDIEKCERAQSEYGGFSGSPILGLSKIISVGTRGECFLKLAELKNDPLICERAGYVDDECYMKAAQRGFQIMCDKINNQDSKSNCYYAYAFVLKNESLCEFVHPTKNQYRDKGGCIYEALH